MNVVKLLLFPFAVLYDLVTRIRNYLYDIGHKSSFQFESTVITVGNLNAGGSGKTPMIEYLISLLKDRYQVATLSRGFKRETKGYRVATQNDSAKSIGDEPFQLYRKFGSQIKVTVGEDRVLAIPNMLHEFPDLQVVLLDDALQHRSVRAQLTILVTEFLNPFYEDFVIPAGRLRESRDGAKRADVIVVTKCEGGISEYQRAEMKKNIQRYAGKKPIFFSGIQYDVPVALSKNHVWSDNLVVVSGIAKSKTILDFCHAKHNVLKHFDFQDHHRYKEEDLLKIEDYCNTIKTPFAIVTTEKDMVKLISADFQHFIERMPWFYIPIRHVFLEGGMNFDELALSAVDATV